MGLRRGRLLLLLTSVLLAARLGDMAVHQAYESPGPLPAARDLVIPPGDAARTANVLRRDGVISHRTIFTAATWLTRRAGPIRAGEFAVPAYVSLQTLLHILRFSPPVEHPVTIPEGLTSQQIAIILNAAPDAAGHIAPPPEGAVLPQTYDYTRGTTRAAILGRAAAAMQTAVALAWAGRDPQTGLTSPVQAVILASIVQQESPLPAELPQIAAVYENRLARGMKLQADPTVIYAATGGARSDGQPISRSDLANPSPYNTYVHNGLPPGPICAPGLTALRAVLHPAATQALFFVATGTGGHVFADDFQQQLQNIAKYRAAMRD